MVPPPRQNTVGLYTQITLLKEIDAPAQVSDIFDLAVSFKFINFNFQIFLLFVPEMCTDFTSYLL